MQQTINKNQLNESLPIRLIDFMTYLIFSLHKIITTHIKKQ